MKDKHELLGKVITGDDGNNAPYIQLSHYGKIVQKYIDRISAVYWGIRLDQYVVMPNHIHMILIVDNGTMKASSPTNPTVSTVIRTFKVLVTKECGFSFWQRSYHDHIIRDEAEYRQIGSYIETNPQRWQQDRYYNKT